MKVLENRMLGTRSVIPWCRDVAGRALFLVVHCFACYAQLNRGVLWHDDRVNCATWCDGVGCRCDVEPP